MSVLSSKAREATHARRQELASQILKGEGEAEPEFTFLSLLVDYSQGDLSEEELKSSVVDVINDEVDIPALDEGLEEDLFELLMSSLEAVLVDVAEEGHLPVVAEEIITGELRVENLDERLTHVLAEITDIPLLPDTIEEELADQLLAVARSAVSRLVIP